MGRCQYASNPARRGFIGYRTVGDRKVGLLEEAMAFQFELDIFHPGGRAPMERGVYKRSEDVPDLRKALTRRLAYRLRMPGAKQRPISVVVKLAVLGSPP